MTRRIDRPDPQATEAIGKTGNAWNLAAALVAALFVALSGPPAGAETATQIIASDGCAMAHCDQALSDNVGNLPPLTDGDVRAAWRDTAVNGSLVGVGCSSNSRTAVCTFKSSSSKPVDIRAYDPDGNVVWSSTALSSNAYYSAPMIGPDGGVLAVDESRIIRFNPQGAIIWSMPTAGGIPISPTVTDAGQVVLATKAGPLSAYDYSTGSMITQMTLTASVRYNGRTYTGYFDTVNTPAVMGNRIYVSGQFKYTSRLRQQSLPVGRLYAVDLVSDGQGGYSFRTAWYFQFRGPSGASPTLERDGGGTVIYFDGSGTDPARPRSFTVFAVRDEGTAGQLLWHYGMPATVQMSPARDPRGGVWFFSWQSTMLLRFVSSGPDPVQSINVNELVSDPTASFVPFSVMTISGNEALPVMTVAAATSTFSKTYVSAIDLNSGSLLWKFRVDEGKGFSGMPSGQYPIALNASGRPVLVFSTRQNGVWALTGPATAGKINGNPAIPVHHTTGRRSGSDKNR